MSKITDAKAKAETELQNIGNAKTHDEIHNAQNAAMKIMADCVNGLYDAANVTLPNDADDAAKNSLAEAKAEYKDAQAVYSDTVSQISDACIVERERVTKEIAAIEAQMTDAEKRTTDAPSFKFPQSRFR